MTMLEEMDEGFRWEAERKRRLRHHRNRIIKEVLCENAWLIALVVGFFAFMLTWNGCVQPTLERAAYLEGRFGLDHNTAMAMARDGYGKTAEEILKEVR